MLIAKIEERRQREIAKKKQQYEELKENMEAVAAVSLFVVHVLSNILCRFSCQVLLSCQVY